MAITKEVAAEIYNCYFEIEKAEKLLSEITKQLEETGEVKLKDGFGEPRGLELGVPCGSNSQRLFNVPAEMAQTVIRGHIDTAKKRLDKLQDAVNNNASNSTIGINTLRDEIHDAVKQKGFWPEGESHNIGERLMLVVSELGEAIEAHREGRMADRDSVVWAISTNDRSHAIEEIFAPVIKDTFEDEIADAIMRLLDLCGALKINIADHIFLKLEYNKTRPKLHGKRY